MSKAKGSRKSPPPATPAEGEVAAVWMKTSALKVWVDNPRKNDEAVGPVAKSIQRFGFGSPIVARKANLEVIKGHTRLKAALKLGLERVPVRLLDVDEEKAHQLAVADNKLGEIADWDEETLAEVLSEFDPSELETMGFTEKDLAKLLSDGDAGGGVGSYEPIFQVLVECKDEKHQAEILEKLTKLDIPCKALTA